MTKTRRTFSSEFKLEAASLILDHDYPIPEASRAVDVGTTALRRRVTQLQQERSGTTPATKALTQEQNVFRRYSGLKPLWLPELPANLRCKTTTSA